MGLEATTKALLDAGLDSGLSSKHGAATEIIPLGITYDVVQTAVVGYCYGDSTSGQVCTHLVVFLWQAKCPPFSVPCITSD